MKIKVIFTHKNNGSAGITLSSECAVINQRSVYNSIQIPLFFRCFHLIHLLFQYPKDVKSFDSCKLEKRTKTQAQIYTQQKTNEK